MSNYTKTVNFAAKDALTTGDANKVVKGTEIDTEFNNIATAVATNANSASPVLVTPDLGTPSAGIMTNVTGLPLTTGVTGTLPVANGGTGGTLPIANGGTGSATLAGAGIITTAGGQTIAGSFTATGAVTFGNSAVTQLLTFNNQSNFISPAGGAGFGQTSPNALYAVFVKPNATSGVGGLVTQNLTTNIGNLAFTDATGTPLISLNSGTLASSTQVGTITTNGTATAYNTSSDYRLKENIVTLANAVTRVKQLAPKNFTWKNNPGLGTAEGFIAHELQAIVPEAVFGEKDGLDQNGKPIYQGVDTSVLVALLTAALQEAITRIEALEAA